MKQKRLLAAPLAVLLGGLACAQSSVAAEKLPAPTQDLPPDPKAKSATAVFAAGCFWCVEAVFESLDGVSEVVSGYAGGDKATAEYKAVSSGDTKHAEAVRIVYDPHKISYGTLLQVLFSAHDPTTKDRQGPDWGAQYRSAIFYASPEQKKIVKAYIAQLEAAKIFGKPIVTTLEPLTEFYAGEDYHQDFVARNPKHGYVVQWAHPKVAKVRKLFPTLVKGAKR